MTRTTIHEPEDQMLLHFLDAQRESVLAIVEGLGEEALHRSIVSSGWTPAELISFSQIFLR